MTHLHRLVLILAGVTSLTPSQAMAQGETTSAIVGQVRDTTNAVVPGVTVSITNLETGLRRSAKTDDAGRFNFPQLKPGTYSVKAEAQGFAPQQNDYVISGLGQKQTVDFTLRVARSNEIVEVNSEAPLIKPENANSSTRPAAATILLAAQMVTATWNSTGCPRSPTGTSSTGWKRTTRSRISIA